MNQDINFVNTMNHEFRFLYTRTGKISYDNLKNIVKAAKTQKQLGFFLVSLRIKYPLITWGRNAIDVDRLERIISSSKVVINNNHIRDILRDYRGIKEELPPTPFLTRAEANSIARTLSRTKKHSPTPGELIRNTMRKRVEEGKLQAQHDKLYGNLFVDPRGSGRKSRRKKKRRPRKKTRRKKKRRPRKN